MQRAELWTWFMHAALQGATASQGETTSQHRAEIAAQAGTTADYAVQEFERRFPGFAR